MTIYSPEKPGLSGDALILPDSEISPPYTKTLLPDYYQSVRSHLGRPPLSDKPDKSNIYLFDSKSGLEPHVYTNSLNFEQHILNSPKPSTRIVSICSPNSVRPLGITENAMRTLMNTYDIDADFLDLVLSFGDKQRSSDAGHGGMIVRHRYDGSYDMQYLFVYAEEYEIRGCKKWTPRQICVFHRYDPSGSANLWILLHVQPDSVVQQRIEAAIRADPVAPFSNCFSLHLLVLSAYMGNWRWFIRSLGEEIEAAVNVALTLDPSNIEKKSDLVEIMKPQYLGDKIMPLSVRLHVALETITKLEEMSTLFHSKGIFAEEDMHRVNNELAFHKTKIQGYLMSVGVLERKIHGISDSVAVALNLNYQAGTAEINKKMLTLNNAQFDDNATVRIVTLVTLTYLPASFVSTVLGMNLFDYADGEFSISRKFWIFVVVAVPLTLLTLGSWYFLAQRRKHRIEERERREREMLESKDMV